MAAENKPTAMLVNNIEVDLAEVLPLVQAGRQLEAVKKVQEFSGASLQESMQAVEELAKPVPHKPLLQRITAPAEELHDGIVHIKFLAGRPHSITYREGAFTRTINPSLQPEWQRVTEQYREQIERYALPEHEAGEIGNKRGGNALVKIAATLVLLLVGMVILAFSLQKKLLQEDTPKRSFTLGFFGLSVALIIALWMPEKTAEWPRAKKIFWGGVTALILLVLLLGGALVLMAWQAG